jgi:Flp pilus assembly protein TadG
MLQAAGRTLRRLGADTSGAEIAEAAAVLPLMFTMLLGIFWFGQAFSIYGTITRAARDGARAAVAPVCATCGASLTPTQVSQNAANGVQNALAAARLDFSLAKPPVPPPTLFSCTDGSAVACDTSQPNICVQENILLNVNPGNPGVCGVSVSLQYPYQFWLPFTTLNKQLIQLHAESHMRMESR